MERAVLDSRGGGNISPAEVAAALKVAGGWFPESAAREVRRRRMAGEKIPRALETLADYAEQQHAARAGCAARARSRRVARPPRSGRRDPKLDPAVWFERFRRAMK